MRTGSLNSTLFLVVILCISAQPAAAAAGPEWTITGMVHYLDDDDRRNTNNGIGGHVGIGTNFINRHAVEVATQYTKLDGTNVNPSVSQWSGTVDYRFRLARNTYLAPYLLLSAGYISNRFKDEALPNDNGLIAALGLGVVTPINRRIAVRTELRYRSDGSNSEQRYSEWILSAGLEFKLTRQKPAYRDSDGDSVVDERDRCEDTPAGADVDQFGCLTNVDADQDGVPDQLDMCAGTPAGASVDIHGCRTVEETLQPEPVEQPRSTTL